jgi:D-alanyl-D-alanine dipeptidase
VIDLNKLFFLILCLTLPSILHANDIEQKFLEAGLIDVNSIDSSIKVDLVNSDSEKKLL